jgi:6,7-dimethyl-8-ribityllumazine synthase
VYAPALMSTQFPTRPDAAFDSWRIAIVASEYNGPFVDGLVEFASDEFRLIAPKTELIVVRTPGSYEIPLAVQQVLKELKPDAVLTFGLIFDGETMHASLIATAVTDALMKLGLDYSVPIMHEVLVAKTEEQARERCLLPAINRGTEAARATVRMLNALKGITKGCYGQKT